MTRIIVADDSATARMFIRKCLEIAGFKNAVIDEAENGLAAMKLLEQAPTDFLVTDLNMPQMDGEQLLAAVKGSPNSKNTPVIVITSAGNDAVTAQLKQAGAFAVLKKPVTPPLLMAALKPLAKS